ncbi:efflux RND transporter periplasmic adaptor subunit [Nannocystis radixulma]|uniref:Efflux RND transporter periplasmic adaptor subunit n=1 Tax=Nannocystis radixulma TaxID=2995305 RepID=A0ABT5BDG1_9BACT|nr:efflux RND transporter periplasmic adaptor subunit [Nannocystis radixulma]MDC0672178.1 efflux RND transporter periplasmic adaptor subunit [Nannocystis radixulma]
MPLARRPRGIALGWTAAASLLFVLAFEPSEARGASARSVTPQAGLALGGLGISTLALQRRTDRRAVGLAGLALACGLISGCEPTSSAAGRRASAGDDSRNSAPPSRDAPARVSLPASAMGYIRVEPAANAPEDMSVRAPARVAFRDNAVSKVDAPVPGRVQKLLVEVGSAVKAGTPLVELASPQASALHLQRERARLELEKAERAVARQDALLRSGIGREIDRHTARLALESARVADTHARRAAQMLGPSRGGRVTVVAPIDGTVLRHQATIGTQAVPGGDPLLEIGDKAALWVVAEVFEDDLTQIHEDAAVSLRFAGVPDPLPGYVVGVGALVDVGQRRAPVYITLDDDAADKATLTPGMFVHASIARPATAGVTLPKQAVLIRGGDQSTAYVEVGPGQFEARDVVVGHTSGERAQIVSGIAPGERVAVSGALLLDQQAKQAL